MRELELPPVQDLKELIRQEHHRAELQRLCMGIEGCGCDLCQELYSTLDLSKYGERVRRYDSLFVIAAGSTSVDLMPPNSAGRLSDKRDDVTKMSNKGIAKETGIVLQGKGRGRPRKPDGEPVSRMTQWRRKREKEVQGVLV